MTGKARGPNVLKGALATVASAGALPLVVPFTYNPATLKRSLAPQTSGGETQARSQAVRFTGPPVQTITVEIDIDATDALASGDSTAIAVGALPALAQIERMIYPSLDQVRANQSQLDQGMLEIAPLTAPRTLFIWGSRRVLPVRITALEVVEELFDARLNPIRATLTLTMQVLSYLDVGPDNRAYFDFMTYQETLDQLAAQGAGKANAAALGVDVASF